MEPTYEPMQCELIDHMGDDLAVVNAARVSFDKEIFDFRLKEDAGLVRYLAKNHHWSPFVHVMVKLRMKAPIYIKNQLWKSHIGAHLNDGPIGEGWNEVSRRYVDSVPTFHRLDAWRGRPVGSMKQGSSDEVIEHIDIVEGENITPTSYDVAEIADHIVANALDAYLKMIAGGIAPELARSILPMSMHTEWIWTGSLLFFARVAKQRIDLHAQKEAQTCGHLIAGAVQKVAPICWIELISN